MSENYFKIIFGYDEFNAKDPGLFFQSPKQVVMELEYAIAGTWDRIDYTVEAYEGGEMVAVYDSVEDFIQDYRCV